MTVTVNNQVIVNTVTVVDDTTVTIDGVPCYGYYDGDTFVAEGQLTAAGEQTSFTDEFEQGLVYDTGDAVDSNPNAALWIVVGAVAVGGAGAVIYSLRRRNRVA